MRRRSVLQRFEHVVTSSQQRSHFFRTVNERRHTTQFFAATPCRPRSLIVKDGAMVPLVLPRSAVPGARIAAVLRR
jgi:hypothetical protein